MVRIIMKMQKKKKSELEHLKFSLYSLDQGDMSTISLFKVREAGKIYTGKKF